MKVYIILFPGFETLDVFGPVEILGKIEDINIGYYSQSGGLITNTDGISIDTKAFDQIKKEDRSILFIPGGIGTRTEINNKEILDTLLQLSEESRYVLTVCTGSALLAKSGALDGRKATSNKRSFEWVKASSDKVNWIKEARWVVDGKFYTSSGISAGMDMALGFISDLYGIETAKQIAFRIEYTWQQDSTKDDFWNQ